MTLLNSDESMDEKEEKIARVKTIIKFLIFGPFILLYSIPVDTYVFFINMYTKSKQIESDVDHRIFSKSSVEILLDTCNHLLEEGSKPRGPKNHLVHFKDLSRELRKRLKVIE